MDSYLIVTNLIVDDLVAKVQKLKLNSKMCDENIVALSEIRESMTNSLTASNEMIQTLKKYKANTFVSEEMLGEKTSMCILTLENVQLMNDFGTSMLSLIDRTKNKIAALKTEKEATTEEIKNIRRKTQPVLSNLSDDKDEETSIDCEICFEKFDHKDHWHSCITVCGHRFGSSCIKAVEHF